MARTVFFSFHYGNDVSRAMVVRNSWVTQGGQRAAGFIDGAEFEKIKSQGDAAIKKWIDEQLQGTSVTVVLIGSETLYREYVQYEICQSLNRGNAIIGIHIHNIKDLNSKTSTKGDTQVKVGTYKDGSPVYFNAIVQGLYDYSLNDGYNNMGTWIESAAKAKGK